MSSEPDPNAEAAHQIQIKLLFYSVALTFTILGLAIQTASFGANVVADLAELLAWLVLLLSGFNGLSLLKQVPDLFGLWAKMHWALGDKKLEGRIAKATSQTDTKYERHWSAFVWGVVLLVVSRGLVPGLDLFERIWAMRL